MGWRADIESHDVMQFLGKGLVIRQFEAAPAVWCKAVLVPDLDDRRGRDPDGLGHRHTQVFDLAVAAMIATVPRSRHCRSPLSAPRAGLFLERYGRFPGLTT